MSILRTIKNFLIPQNISENEEPIVREISLEGEIELLEMDYRQDSTKIVSFLKEYTMEHPEFSGVELKVITCHFSILGCLKDFPILIQDHGRCLSDHVSKLMIYCSKKVVEHLDEMLNALEALPFSLYYRSRTADHGISLLFFMHEHRDSFKSILDRIEEIKEGA